MERAFADELMDAPDLDPAVYARVLGDLARVNTLLRGRAPTLAWLARATAGLPAFSVLDVGFGYGDMLRAVVTAARARGQRVRAVGVDLNPGSAAVAAAATDPALDIEWRTGAAQAVDFAPDFILTSLVAHHMAEAELAGFLAWQESAARRGWLINDLHRHPMALAGFRALAAAMRWHPIVRHDGALSVRRAFVRSDWDRLLAAAGLAEVPVAIRWHLAFRWTVSRLK